MSTTVIYNSVVKARVQQLVSGLPEDGTMAVTIGKVTKSRSKAQNRLMWLWFTVAGTELGYSKQEMHDAMCEHILGTEFKEGPYGEFQSTRGTSGLKADEMTQFLSQVEVAVSQLGIILPHPEDIYYRAMGYIK